MSDGTESENVSFTEGSSFQSEPIDGFNLLESGSPAIYRSLYERIFWDLDLAYEELSGERISYANIIHAAAHLRLVIEGIAIASFVASHNLVSEAGYSIRNASNYDSARKTLKKLNPNFWPVSFGPVVHEGQQGSGVRPGVGLHEGEVGRYFGSVSEVLHAQTPYVEKKKRPAPEEYLQQYLDLHEKLNALISSHIVQLADSPEYLYLHRSAGEIRVQAFRSENPMF